VVGMNEKRQVKHYNIIQPKTITRLIPTNFMKPI